MKETAYGEMKERMQKLLAYLRCQTAASDGPPPTGACFYPAGWSPACVSGMDPQACTASGGVRWEENVDCDIPPPSDPEAAARGLVAIMAKVLAHSHRKTRDPLGECSIRACHLTFRLVTTREECEAIGGVSWHELVECQGLA
jgi:hypothetical protein